MLNTDEPDKLSEQPLVTIACSQNNLLFIRVIDSLALCTPYSKCLLIVNIY